MHGLKQIVNFVESWFSAQCVLVVSRVWLCNPGDYSFLRSMCVLVSQSYPILVTPWTVARQAPLSMETLQARILEWVAMLSSRGSSQPRDETQVSHVAGGFFTDRATREAQFVGRILYTLIWIWFHLHCVLFLVPLSTLFSLNWELDLETWLNLGAEFCV